MGQGEGKEERKGMLKPWESHRKIQMTDAMTELSNVFYRFLGLNIYTQLDGAVLGIYDPSGQEAWLMELSPLGQGPTFGWL